jgi:hypothetical protein
MILGMRQQALGGSDCGSDCRADHNKGKAKTGQNMGGGFLEDQEGKMDQSSHNIVFNGVLRQRSKQGHS